MGALSSLFDTIVAKPCADFVACRDHEFKRDCRAALDDAWRRHRVICPEGDEFVRHFQLEFHQRSWELWLMSVLSASGLRLEPPPSEGPDILVRQPTGPKLWIEAVVPTPGAENTPDRVWQRPPGDAGPFKGPRCEHVALRYLSAIRDKLAKLSKYRERGIVGEDDACLVAVGQGAILDGDLCDLEVPLMVRAVFGIGSPLLVVPFYGEGEPYSKTPPMPTVAKASGAAVPATGFLDGSASGLAGVLFAQHAVWNLDWNANRSLRIVHNPTATVPLGRGTVSAYCEMWVEDGFLHHSGCCSRFGFYSVGS